MKKLIAICGKAASGKDAVASALIKKYKDQCVKKVAFTTRAPRPNEIDGIDYHFVTDMQFFHLVEMGAMLEVTDFNDDIYGTGANSLLDDAVNVGTFDWAGIEILRYEEELDMEVFYIDRDDKVRLIEQLKNRDYTIDAIYDRYKFEREMFDGVDTDINLTILDNNSTTTVDSMVDTISKLSKRFFEKI